MVTVSARWLVLGLLVGLSAAYSLDDATADHEGRAIELDEEGDLPGAIASFRAAVRFGETSEALSNLATALLDERHVPDNAEATREEALELLHKALRKNPGNDAAQELMNELDGDPCAEENLRYTLSEADHARGHLSRDTLAQLTQAFSDCGVVLLSGAMGGKNAKFFKQLQAEQSKHYKRFLANDLHKADAEERSKGRYEIRTPFERPFVSSELLENKYIHSLANSFLATERTEIDTLSSVVSQPNTKAQHWHRDAAALWNDREIDGLLPHGIVVFMPLVDVSMREGPTEFLLKSHLPCAKHKEVQLQLPDLDVHKRPTGGVWTLDECPWSTDRFVATGKAGDAILFDVRILHRGGKNTTPKPRPMMYYSYVQEWWVDAVNFHPRQTKGFDRFNTRMRKLITRLDSREYTQLIESKLQELGVDTKALQSKYNYARVDFKEFAQGKKEFETIG